MSVKAVLLNDTRVDAHFGCDLVCTAIEHLLASKGIELVATSPAHNDWRSDKPLRESMATAQLILVNGEGTIHHERPAGKVLLEAGRFAREHGVPAALINAGWEANGPLLERRLQDFSLLAWRDTKSARAVEHLDIESRVVPDLSLYEISRRLGNPHFVGARGRQGVGFTDSVDRETTMALFKAGRRLGASPICIHQGSPGVLRFMRNAVSLRQDTVHPLRLMRILRNRASLWRARLPNAESFVNRIGSLQMLFSGRFHACTVALATRTPVVGVRSNTTKIQSLFSDAGLNPDRNLEVSALPKIGTSLARWSSIELDSLDRYLARAVDDAKKLFDDLRLLASRN